MTRVDTNPPAAAGLLKMRKDVGSILSVRFLAYTVKSIFSLLQLLITFLFCGNKNRDLFVRKHKLRDFSCW